MKKSLIALAVASVAVAPVAANADATLYGKVEALLQKSDATDADLKLDDIIFGLKGSQDTNFDGVSAIYQIELELNESDVPESLASESNGVDTRLAYAGLTGGFGTVIAGRITNPTDSIEAYSDVSNKAGWFNVNPDRLGSALAYVSPEMSGFQGYAGLVMDANTVQKTDASGAVVTDASGNPVTKRGDNVDGYTLGVNYNAGPLSAGIGMWSFSDESDLAANENADDLTKWLIGGSYTFADVLTWGVTYQHMNFTRDLTRDGDGSAAAYEDAYLAGTSLVYTMGDLAPYIQYNKYDSDARVAGDKDAYDGDEWAVGANYALGAKASVGVEYSNTSFDADNTDDYHQFNVSYTVKF